MRLLFSIALAGWAALSFGQDIHFSQFDLQPLHYNPGYAGLFDGDYRISGIERTQWRSVTTPYQTFGLAGDLRNPGHSRNTAVGLSIYQDRAGDSRLGQLQVNLTGAFHIPLSADSTQILSVGITTGITHFSIDYAQLQFDNQWGGTSYDPNLATGEAFARDSRTYVNMALGAAYHKRWAQRNIAYGGLAIHNLTRPNQSFQDALGVKLNPRISAHGWVSIAVAEEWDLQPSILWQAQDRYREVLMGASARYLLSGLGELHQAVLAGFYFRAGDAGYLLVGGEYGPWKAGITYDFNWSNLTPASDGKGGLELAVQYIFKRIDPGALPLPLCPDFL